MIFRRQLHKHTGLYHVLGFGIIGLAILLGFSRGTITSHSDPDYRLYIPSLSTENQFGLLSCVALLGSTPTPPPPSPPSFWEASNSQSQNPNIEA